MDPEQPPARVPPVEQVVPGVWSIPIPMPGPLAYANVFALEHARGVVLVDAGWRGEDGIAPLEAGLAVLGAAVADVEGILLTHGHLDHYGLVDDVRSASDAWAALHPADAGDPVARALRDRDGVEEWLAGLGVGAGELRAFLDTLESFAPGLSTPKPDRALRDGDVVADGKLVVVHTPGHSPGHVCFVCASHDVVFTGDHVLAETTPNVSVRPLAAGSPLDDYLASLGRIVPLHGLTALPGHEARVDAGARAAEILAHHDRQLSVARSLVDAGARTVREVAEEMEWSTPWASLGPVDVFLALGETLAHLLVLEGRGQVVRAGTTVQQWLPAPESS